MATEVAEIEVLTEYPSRLQMSMLAPVKKMAAMIKEGDKEVRVIGYIFGVARGVSFRNNPNGDEAAEALQGAFEGIPSYLDEAWMEDGDKCSKRARLASAVCFLPSAANRAVVKAILGPDYRGQENPKRGKRVDQLGIEVPINIEVGIRKTGGEDGVGYEWVVRGLAKISGESPIERMRKALGTGPGADLKALVDRSEKGSTTPAKSGKTTAKKKR